MEMQSASRGLRLMTIAAAVVMIRFIGEALLSLWAMFGDVRVDQLLRWLARLQFAHAAATLMLLIGTAQNLSEVRARRVSPVPAVLAMIALAGALAFHAWLWDLLGDLSTSLRRLNELEELPTRMFFATLAYLGGLFGIVIMIRSYALADGNQALREQARLVGGWIAGLAVADTMYRFTFGLGGGMMLGISSVVAAFALLACWALAHRQFGALVDTTRYFVRASAEAPRAAVIAGFDDEVAPTRSSPVTGASPARVGQVEAPPAPSAIAAPPPARAASAADASGPIRPIAAEAPDRDEAAPTPTADGPRFLR